VEAQRRRDVSLPPIAYIVPVEKDLRPYRFEDSVDISSFVECGSFEQPQLCNVFVIGRQKDISYSRTKRGVRQPRKSWFAMKRSNEVK
jgi:hypothetical protein